MPDAAPLLAAIASNPDDDLPRLVYADWLDENGDPTRAEFIRLQCHTARVGPFAPTWAPAKLREFDLFKANEARWRTPTASTEGRMLMDRWRRGFPAEVMLADVARGRLTNGEWANGVYDWTANPNERYDPWPGGAVREVTFNGWDEECGDLLWHPQLRGVRSLSLREWYAGVGTRRAEAFVTDLSLLPPDHFPELTSLSFGDGHLTLNALETLTAAAVVGQLTHLSLGLPSDLPAGESADWLAAAGRLLAAVAPRLEVVSLGTLPADFLAAFAAHRWPVLRKVSVMPEVGGLAALTTAAHLPRLETLNVWQYFYANAPLWTPAAVERLARWPALAGVKRLHLGGFPPDQLDRLFGAWAGGELDAFIMTAHDSPSRPLALSDLTACPPLGRLKTLDAPLTHAALAPLADPDVLPELHTIWSDDTEPLTGLRWRGGARTVIPTDPPDSRRVRPSRGSWCSG